MRKICLIMACALSFSGLSACQGDPAPPADQPLGWAELQDLSAFERDVLADKKVTADELERAGQLLVSCLAGAQIRTVVDPGAGPDGIQSEFDGTRQAEVDRLTAADARCRSEVSAVAAVWVLQHQLTPDEQAAAKQDFLKCTRQAGLDLSLNASFEEAFVAATQRTDPDVGKCINTVQAALRTALPGLAEALDRLKS